MFTFIFRISAIAHIQLGILVFVAKFTTTRIAFLFVLELK